MENREKLFTLISQFRKPINIDVNEIELKIRDIFSDENAPELLFSFLDSELSKYALVFAKVFSVINISNAQLFFDKITSFILNSTQNDRTLLSNALIPYFEAFQKLGSDFQLIFPILQQSKSYLQILHILSFFLFNNSDIYHLEEFF